MYTELYDLFNHFIFRDMASDLANTDLICTLLSSIGVIFVAAVPFMIVWKVIKVICG